MMRLVNMRIHMIKEAFPHPIQRPSITSSASVSSMPMLGDFLPSPFQLPSPSEMVAK